MSEFLNQKITVTEDIVSRINQDGTFILMKMDEDNVFFKIDGIAAKVWAEIAEGNNLKEVRDNVLSEYNVDENTLDQDIKNLITELEVRSLITRA